MKPSISRREIIKVIHSEVARYAARDFWDDEDLLRDVHVVGDDLTAAALRVEKRLGVKIERSQYPAIHTVNELADAIERALSEQMH